MSPGLLFYACPFYKSPLYVSLLYVSFLPVPCRKPYFYQLLLGALILFSSIYKGKTSLLMLPFPVICILSLSHSDAES